MVGWKVALWAALVLAALWFLYAVRSVLLPFVLALIISALLDPSIRKLRMRGYSRGVSVALVFFLFFGVMTAIGIYVGPIVGSQLAKFKGTLEYYSQQLSAEDPTSNYFVRWNPVIQASPPTQNNQIDKLLESLKPTLTPLGIPTTRRAIVEQYIEPHRKEITQTVQGFFRGFLGIVGTAASQLFLLIFTPIFVWMMLMNMERFKIQSISWIPPSIRAETLGLLRDIGDVFFRYLRGITITVMSYGAVMAIVLTILGAPYSVLLAVLFACLYPIPYLGPAINATVLAVVTGLSGVNQNLFLNMQSSWSFALAITGIYIACSLLFDNLVYPQIVGKAVGLHPLVSMFVIFSGGALFGVLGMILAFPVTGSIKVILERVLKVTSSTGADNLDLPITPLRHRAASEV